MLQQYTVSILLKDKEANGKNCIYYYLLFKAVWSVEFGPAPGEPALAIVLQMTQKSQHLDNA